MVKDEKTGEMVPAPPGVSQTPLQEKLATMAEKIGDVGFACAILTFCSLVVRVALEMLSVVPCGC
jgi:hypothetical protein